MYFNPRNIFYSDVIAFPSAKSAGALTLYSDEYALNSILKSHIVIHADDLSKITDTLTVYVKGSFDDGAHWMTLGTYTDLAAGSGSLTVRKEVAYAPLIKLEAIFSSSGALASGHGIFIDVVMEEDSEQLSKEFFYDVLTLSSGSTETAYFDVTLTAGSKETAVFTVTGAPTADGDLTVAGVAITVADLDDEAGVATKIAAGTYTDWVATADGAEVTFTGKANGNLSALVFDAGTTGVTIGSIVQTDGTPTPATGNVTIAGETFALTTVASANDIAADIADHSFTNWTVSASTNRVTFTAKTVENVTDLTASSSATGVTFSAVTTSQGIAVAGSQTISGDILNIESYEMIDSVEVLASGVVANINNTTLYVYGSIDGINWYAVNNGTAFNAAAISFVTSGFVGNRAKVVLVTASNGSLESGHSIVVSTVLKY